MSTRFYPRQKDYIPQLNAMDDDVQDARTKGAAAAQASIDAVAARDLAQLWATKLATAVAGGEFSAKYHAQAAAGSATAASTSSGTASSWATSLSVVSGGLYGARYYAQAASTSASSASGSAGAASDSATAAASSASTAAGHVTTISGVLTSASSYATEAQKWAVQLGAAVAGGEYSAKYHAQAAAGSSSSAGSSATLAQNWAVQATGEVVTGQGYSAKYWAAQAAISAGQASAGQLNSDWNAVSGLAQILNKPAIPPAITGAATTIATANLSTSKLVVTDSNGKIAAGTVTSTEGGYLSGVTSNIQTQLNGKQATIVAGTTAQYWRGDKSWQTLDKAAVGLSSVENYSAAGMPISTATQTQLDLKASITYVDGKVAALVNSSPALLDTLDELAAAIGDDANFAATTAAAIGGKEPAITAGTGSQYWKGTKVWADFATDVRAAVLTGLSTATATAAAAADTVLVAIGKLQAQVTARLQLAGGTMSGAIDMAANQIVNMRYRGASAMAAFQSVGTGTMTVDVSAVGKSNLTATGAVAFAFSNWPSTGEAYVRVDFINFGNYTITPPTVTWTNPDGTETTSLSAHFAALAAAGGRSGFTSNGRTKAVFWNEANGTVYGAFI